MKKENKPKELKEPKKFLSIMKRPISIIISVGIVIVLIICIMLAVKNNREDNIVYRETTATVGNLVVGISESGSVDIGTEDDTFDLDISALVRDSGSSSNSSASGSSSGSSGISSGMGGGQGMGGVNMSAPSSSSAAGGNMDMFSQIFSFASDGSGNNTTSANSLDIASVNVTVGQEVAEGDVLYYLEEDSVSDISTQLETDVEKAKADLETAMAEQKQSSQSAQHTYDSSVAYGKYAKTEYDETIANLESNITTIESSLELANQELANYQSKLDYLIQYYGKAKEVYEAAQWAVDNPNDKDSLLYLYVWSVEERDQAKSNYETFLSEKEQLEDNIESTQDTINSLTTQLSTAKRSLEQGKLSAKETYDLRLLAYDTASETYDIAMAYVDQDKEDAESAYEDASERWNEFSESIQGNAVIAKKSGIVTSVSLEAGDKVSTGDTLVTLYDLDDVTMAVNVSEDDMTDIALGGAANIVFTAYPDEVFEAKVSEISDASTDSSGNVYYTVTVTISGDVKKLYQDMTGEVTFVTKEEKTVLYVSNRAIIRTNGKSYVKVKDSNDVVSTKEVTTGFSDGVNVEITDGLSEGDVVLIESKVSD